MGTFVLKDSEPTTVVVPNETGITKLIRYAIGPIGGFIIAHGLASPAVTDVLVGSLVQVVSGGVAILIPIAWSIIRERIHLS